MAQQIPDNVFRGYDLAGLSKASLTKRTSSLSEGICHMAAAAQVQDCVVGFDCRTTSPKFRDMIVKGLTEAGITVYDIGLTLSQISYFAQYYFRTRGLVMITGSHNPKEYNGFKIGMGFSETMLTEEIIELREIVKTRAFISKTPKGKCIQKDIFNEYVDDLFSKVGNTGKFKVVIDSCSATTGVFLPTILKRAGCEVIEQNTALDGNFPLGTPDPTESAVQERLARRVVAEKADIGFSYDSDGDRVGVVDQDGTLIWNDTLVSLFAKDVIEFLPGSKIVYNVLCSKQVDEVVRQSGGIPIIWKTGHSFIKAKSKEVRAAFGGELSGHFFFLDNFYGHDDAAMASLRLLAYLTRTKMSLKEAVARLPHYFTSPEIKVGCPDDIKFGLISGKISKDIKALYPTASYVEIDGIRMDNSESMLVIRASQNGPYLTVKFEGKTTEAYDMLKRQISTVLHNHPNTVDFSKGSNTGRAKLARPGPEAQMRPLLLQFLKKLRYIKT